MGSGHVHRPEAPALEDASCTRGGGGACCRFGGTSSRPPRRVARMGRKRSGMRHPVPLCACTSVWGVPRDILPPFCLCRSGDSAGSIPRRTVSARGAISCMRWSPRRTWPSGRQPGRCCACRPPPPPAPRPSILRMFRFVADRPLRRWCFDGWTRHRCMPVIGCHGRLGGGHWVTAPNDPDVAADLDQTRHKVAKQQMDCDNRNAQMNRELVPLSGDFKTYTTANAPS